MKIAYLDCFSGISGDMFLAALIDAGVPFTVVDEAVSELGLGAKLQLHRVDRSGIDSAKVDVLTASGELAETAHTAALLASSTHDHLYDARTIMPTPTLMKTTCLTAMSKLIRIAMITLMFMGVHSL